MSNLLLLLGGLALAANTVGWTTQTHLHVHDRGCDDHEGHSPHRDDHDSDACAICQQLAQLSKHIIIVDVSILTLDLPRIHVGSRALEIVSSLPVLKPGFPRAPPSARPVCC